MTFLSAMVYAEKSIQRSFARQLVKVVFILIPGYDFLSEALQFVFVMVILFAEGRFDVVMPARNRKVDANRFYPSRSEHPAVWSEISRAIQGFKDHSTTHVVLNEGLVWKFQNLADY